MAQLRAVLPRDTRLIVTALAGTSALLALLACASSGTTPQTTATPQDATVIPQNRTISWPIKTREHVDLWLHGFALLDTDSSARVPYFKRGYRDEVTVQKNKANVFTQLDANVEKLSAQVRSNRALVNAQFVPLYFTSVDQMHATIDHFIAANGSQSGAKSREEAAAFAVLASYFQNASDRAFLSLFASSLWDEHTKFFGSYWTQQQRARANVIDSVQAMWQNNVRPRMQRILNNTQQRNGDILLSLPLGGEGRTIGSTGVARTTMAVNLPQRPSDVAEAIYAIVHEMMGSVASGAVADNTTPAEQRNGVADQITGIATVRCGLMLMENSFPELADGYARYYVRATGRTPGANPRAELITLFPLPDAIRDALARQIESVQGGI